MFQPTAPQIFHKIVKILKIVKKIQKRRYKIQKIEGLPKKKVTPPEEFYARIKKENKLIATAREVHSDLSFFFVQPIIFRPTI